MSMLTIAQKHGKEMYVNGLKHAINMFEIGELGGYEVAATATLLKKRIDKVEAEIKSIEKEEVDNV